MAKMKPSLAAKPIKREKAGRGCGEIKVVHDDG
jgi:hypothetical protein